MVETRAEFLGLIFYFGVLLMFYLPEHDHFEDFCHGTEIIENPSEIHNFMEKYFKNINPGSKIQIKEEFEMENSLEFMTDLKKLEESGVFEANFNFFSPLRTAFIYSGDFNSMGQFHGKANLEFLTPQKCNHTFCKASIQAFFQNGILQDVLNIYSEIEDLLITAPIDNGFVHGIVIFYGSNNPLYAEKMIEFDNFDIDQNDIWPSLNALVKFVGGKPSLSWKTMIQEPQIFPGYLYGFMNSNREISSSESRGAYIYPHGKMALVGKFAKNKMIFGQKAKLSRATCLDNFLHVQFSQTQGPKYHFSPGQEDSASKFDKD